MRRTRVLVVDDEPGMLRSVERVLGDEMHLVCLSSPRQALEAIASFTPDVALLDIRMPEMSGFELMDRLVTALPDLDVIFMTGSVDELDSQLIRAIRAKAFYFIQKPFDREVLRALVDRCVDARWLMTENVRHVRRLERELADARAFQLSTLPADRAVLAGVSIAAGYQPCAELGGDFYDYAATADGRVALLVADVVGHGVSAAMLTAVVKSAFHAAHVDDYDPVAVAERVSAGMSSFGPRRFVTLVCVRISADRHSIEYVNAGHPPGLLGSHRRGVKLLEDTGPMIGSGLPDQSWHAQQARLHAHGRVLLYTDGLTDLDTPNGPFGRQPLLAAVESTTPDSNLTAFLHDQVRALTAGAPLLDDVTFLVAWSDPNR